MTDHPVSDRDRQLLLTAREQIVRKDYAAARHTLAPIRDQATARKWLAKLDEIDPPTAPSAASPETPFAPVTRLPSPPPPPAPAVVLPTPQAGPRLKPRDPVSLSIWWLMLAPVGMVLYARNWKNLGKPDWQLPTLLIWVSFLVMAGANAFMSPVWDGDHNPTWVVLLVLTMSANQAMWIGIGEMQQSAYKAWRKHQNTEQLVRHPYKMGRFALMFGGALVLFTLLGSAIILYTLREHTYSDHRLTLAYSGHWKSVDPARTGIEVANADEDCFLALSERRSDSVLIGFIAIPNTQRWPLKTLDDAVWLHNWSTISGARLFSTGYYTIGGQSSITREFEYTYEGDHVYVKTFHLLLDDTLLQIMVWSTSYDVFRDEYSAIMDVVDSITLTSTSNQGA